MKHFVNRSGGTGSWYTGRRVIDLASPGDEVHFVFADTRMEDGDLYRFLDDTEKIDTAYSEERGIVPVFHRLVDGRTPWEVFFGVKYLGNTRIDPCSKILKRDLIRRFLEDSFDVDDTTVYIGIDWSEIHRFEKAKPYWTPYRVEAPLCEPPFMDKEGIHKILEREGVALPRLYDMGFAHNNCGGFCIKAGQASFKLLLEQMPERYAYHEAKEQEFNLLHRQDKEPVTIMRDRSRKSIMKRLGLTSDDVYRETLRERLSWFDKDEGRWRSEPAQYGPWTIRATGEALPTQLPLSMRQFRIFLETGEIEVDPFDLGGCACFTPDSDYDDASMTQEVAS